MLLARFHKQQMLAERWYFFSDWLLFASCPCGTELQPFWSAGLGRDWGPTANCRGTPYPGLLSGNGGPGSIHAFYPLCCWWVRELGSEQQRSDRIPASPGLQRPAVKVMEAGSPWAQRAQDHLGRMGTPQPAPSRRKGSIFRVGSRERRLGGEESVLFLSQACSCLAIPDSLPEAGLLLPLVFPAARAFLRRSSQPSRGLGRCLVHRTVRQSRDWCGRHSEPTTCRAGRGGRTSQVSNHGTETNQTTCCGPSEGDGVAQRWVAWAPESCRLKSKHSYATFLPGDFGEARNSPNLCLLIWKSPWALGLSMFIFQMIILNSQVFTKIKYMQCWK